MDNTVPTLRTRRDEVRSRIRKRPGLLREYGGITLIILTVIGVVGGIWWAVAWAFATLLSAPFWPIFILVGLVAALLVL